MAREPKVWIITDLHLDHNMLVELGHRPAGYEIEIFANINSEIKSGDTIVCLGDVAFGNAVDNHMFLTTLSVLSTCKKWLLKGNHDNGSYKWYLRHGWDFVAESFMWKRYGYNITFSHRPQRIIDDPKHLNVHGHWHGSVNRYYNVYKDWITDRHIQVDIEGHFKPHNLKHIITAYRNNKIKEGCYIR